MRNTFFAAALIVSMSVTLVFAQESPVQTVTNCKGQLIIQKKNHGKDLVGYTAALIGKITKNDRVKVCVAPKQFILPSVASKTYDAPVLTLPPHAIEQSSALSLSATPIPFTSSTLPVLPPPVVNIDTKTTKISNERTMRLVHKQAYVVPLTITKETAQKMEITPGDYPANYLETQKKDGQWSKRVMTVARVSQASNGSLVCNIFLKHAPAKNAAVAIDFQNGQSIEVTSEMLKGVMTPAITPTLKKKQYMALKAAYQVKTPVLLTLFRVVLPVLPQALMGSVAMGPPGAAMPIVGLIQNMAIRKIVGNQRTMATVQNPSLHVNYVLAEQRDKLDWQGTRITSLELQIKSLKEMVMTLGKTTTSDAVKIPKSDRRNRR